jgi:hypothetical protein
MGRGSVQDDSRDSGNSLRYFGVGSRSRGSDLGLLVRENVNIHEIRLTYFAGNFCDYGKKILSWPV